MNATTSKIVALCVLLLETCFSGVLPLFLISYLKRAGASVNRILELANLFAGGVFLATLLLHLIPEAGDILDEALEKANVHIDYPLSEILVAAGFFLIAITEQVAFCFHHSVPEDCAPLVHNHSHSSHNDHTHNDIVSHPNHETSPLIAEERTESPQYNSVTDSTQNVLQNSCSHNAPVHIGGTHDHLESDVLTTSRKTLTIRSLLFFLALSLHSLFEGVAIGLQQSVSDVMETLLAVAIHKLVIAFSFTLSMTQQHISLKIILFYVVALALISPAGIAIGIGVSEIDAQKAADMANGVLQSISSGTFLFVVFFEILPRELHCHRRLEGALNLICTLLGFGLMAGLQAVGSHDHSHGSP